MNLTYEIIEKGYKILDDGIVWIVQDGFIPNEFKRDSYELSAQAHISSIIEERETQNQNEITIENLKTTISTLQENNSMLLEQYNNLSTTMDIVMSEVIPSLLA